MKVNNLSEMDLEQLFEEIDKIAEERFDGHYSLFKFTTNWLFVFGTTDNIFEMVHRESLEYPNGGWSGDRETMVYGVSLEDVLRKGITRYKELNCNIVHRVEVKK